MPKPSGFHEAFERLLPGAVLLDETGSTNDEARLLARGGAPHLAVVVAEQQSAGRGRRGRTWSAAPGEALLASWVARPSLPVDRWSLLPLFAGVAVAEAVRARTSVEAVLKWPNDVLVDERKLAGILVEAEPPAFAVVGVGLNVSQTTFDAELNATSLALSSAVRLDRADLLAAILERVDGATLERYRELCVTIGRRVRVITDDGDVEGIATEVDERGALVVEGVAITAGDVVHVR